MADGMLRSPTFLVGAERQRKNLDEFKRREQQLAEAYHKNKPLCFNACSYQKTHPVKAQKGHKDADACLTVPMVLGVADGVSQIEDFGIDASMLPNELLHIVEQLGMHQLIPGAKLPAADTYRGPVSMLRRAFEATESLGSLTVVLAVMDNSTRIHGKLHPMIAIITVGDCELLVLRRVKGPRCKMADLLGSDEFQEDPAAEFLAREQDDLAELGEDFGGGQSETNELNDFEDSVDDQPVVNGFADEEISGSHQPVVPLPRESEPESVRKWREEKAALLDKMDSEEKSEIQEWREQAKKELNDWYERRDEQLGKTQTSNRADEEAFVADRDDSSTPGHDWERVCRNCDFNPKGTKNTKDVSRMRSIFLQLKQTPLVKE